MVIKILPDQVRDRAIAGTMTLTAQRAVIKAIDALGIIFLARLLTETEFGIFGIINFIVFTLFGFLSDIGLGASLIQKKTSLKKVDMATVFTVQLVLVAIVNGLIWLLSPTLIRLYQLSGAQIWLLRATGFCLLLTCFKTIPSALLQRELLYQKLLIPEITETVVYNLLAVVLAIFGFGVWSLTGALLLRTFLGALILGLVSPWPISLAVDRQSLRGLLKFGVPYQANSLLALLKDNLTPTIIAFFYGPAAVGFVNLAQSIAAKPMEITNIVNRVVFPTFAKIQDDRVRVGAWLEKGVRLMAYVYLPLVFGLLVSARPVLRLIYASKSDKWLPALPALYPFLLGAIPVVFTTTATNVLFSLGQSKAVLKLMVIYTVLTWAVGLPLIIRLGFEGIAWAGVLVGLVSIFLVAKNLKKARVPFSLARAVKVPLLASVLMAAILWWPMTSLANQRLLALVFWIIMGGLIYIGCLFLILRGRIKEELILVKSLIPKRFLGRWQKMTKN
ncbi:MAG: oligosaccharide flippase family protein [Candidatus Shapirobacteria bacterium]|nr:oligosaccharide flippase family protein [Candidatus Shapirobacteria bacterium]MDD5481764.1 oligosaccharide flippase family protein [Candidatus Shapirobacteria bacterium]